MDYEKAYKDALERARVLNNGEDVEVEEGTTTCEYIFPELQMSEDERIRKEIIEFLQLPHRKFVGKRNQEEWIEWLQKQNEKTLTIDIDSMVEAYRQRHLNQGIIFKNSTVVNMCVNMCVAAYKRGIENTLDKLHLKQSEQNLTWSEEDEERIEQICEDLKCGLENFRSGKNVKGLHFEEIINSNINWLKSLKLQPHWKPTEEQMEALNVVCKCYYTVHILSNNDCEKIKSLYNDLKKL